jgi:hypothetical protein
MYAGALAGKSKLRRLDLLHCGIPGGATELAQLLLQLHSLQQLKHLNLRGTVREVREGTPAAAAFAGLTASSKLQHLNISCCTLPAGAWQHIFSAGRRLSHLTALDISGTLNPFGKLSPPPDSNQLVRCCPSLQSYDMGGFEYTAGVIAPLRGLGRLRNLSLVIDVSAAECLQDLGQLTSLENAELYSLRDAGGLALLPLAQLTRLTALCYAAPFNRSVQRIELNGKVCRVDIRLLVWQLCFQTVWHN